MTKKITTPMWAKTSLRHTLETQGRQVDWLADHIGLSSSHMSRVLSGQRPLDADNAMMLATLLGVPSYLIFQYEKQRVASQGYAYAGA